MAADLARPLEVAVAAAREAAALLRTEFHRPGGPRGRHAHAPIDEEAEQVIRARLLLAFPDWGYRGEESGSAGLDPPPHYVWLVDPNDGTRPYLSGVRGSAVSIALLRDRQPVLGVVYAPCAPDSDGDLIAWAEGCGPPFRNGEAVDRAPWPSTLGPHDLVVASHDSGLGLAAHVELIAPARFRGMPSIAYRLALVAAGDGTVATSFKGAGDWDYAAGQALLRATGADLFDERGSAAVYSELGVSRGKACFGGAREVVRDLLAKPWEQVYRFRPSSQTAEAALPRASVPPGAAIADAALLRRAHGCLLGQIAGDSLGSLVEGLTAEAIQRTYPMGLCDLEDGGVHQTIAGQPTDDSEMALVLARSIVASGRRDSEAAARAYGYWYQTHPFDIGATTAQALRAIPGLTLSEDPSFDRLRMSGSFDRLRMSGGLPSAAEAAARAASRDSQANGALMRASPLGIWGYRLHPDALAEAARADSRLTHPNPVCQEACAVYVVAIAHAVATGGSGTEVYRFTRGWAEMNCREPAVVEALAAAHRQPPTDFIARAGWVLVAFQNAFYRLLHAPMLEAGIVDTAMAGGDTDTNAAIAGALLGAVHGRAAVPARWRNLILSCRPIAGVPGVRHPRPEPFWPVDALELAECLLIAGSGAGRNE